MHKDEHPEYKYRPRRRPKGIKRGYNTPTMMMAAGIPGKPYAIPANWARVINTADGEAIAATPRLDAAQIVYATDGTQYYAVAKGTGFTPSMAAPGGSVIVSPTQVAAATPAAVPATTTASTNYPAYVTVPLPATSTAIFHPVAIPVQGVHTPAFVLRPPYHGATAYSPTILQTATTTTAQSVIPIAYPSVEQKVVETQPQQTIKTESTNTIVKTQDGETIVIIRPAEGNAVPIQLRDAAATNGIAVATQSIIQPQHIVQAATPQQEIKHIILEQPQAHHVSISQS